MNLSHHITLAVKPKNHLNFPITGLSTKDATSTTTLEFLFRLDF